MSAQDLPVAKLIRAALDARDRAYTPYSGFRVGAALLCNDGRIYTGCNIENASYSVCNCAERTALFSAVADGYRSFLAVAVVGGRDEENYPLSAFAYPCGVCRQALGEFSPDMDIIVAKDLDHFEIHPFAEILPHAFGPSDLSR